MTEAELEKQAIIAFSKRGELKLKHYWETGYIDIKESEGSTGKAMKFTDDEGNKYELVSGKTHALEYNSFVLKPIEVEEKKRGTWKVVMQDDVSIIIMCDVPTNGLIPSDQERHAIAEAVKALMEYVTDPYGQYPHDNHFDDKAWALMHKARNLIQKGKA